MLSAVQGDRVTLTEITMTAVVTLGTVASAAVSVNMPALTRQSEATADQVTCRAVDTAIMAYYTEQQALPTVIADVTPYLQGDVSAYRVVSGRADGPGCDTLHRR
jgi:type II secretory pathway pseudopilin PulG